MVVAEIGGDVFPRLCFWASLHFFLLLWSLGVERFRINYYDHDHDDE